jgi:hypothetical protein
MYNVIPIDIIIQVDSACRSDLDAFKYVYMQVDFTCIDNLMHRSDSDTLKPVQVELTCIPACRLKVYYRLSKETFT